VVLSRLDDYLPGPGSSTYPADTIAIVDLTFGAILFVGILSAFLDFNNIIKTISISIRKDPDGSPYRDPEIEDIREESQISRGSSLGFPNLAGGNVSGGKKYHDEFLTRLFGQPVQ
jgi:hypothetical protein